MAIAASKGAIAATVHLTITNEGGVAANKVVNAANGVADRTNEAATVTNEGGDVGGAIAPPDLHCIVGRAIAPYK